MPWPAFKVPSSAASSAGWCALVKAAQQRSMWPSRKRRIIGCQARSSSDCTASLKQWSASAGARPRPREPRCACSLRQTAIKQCFFQSPVVAIKTVRHDVAERPRARPNAASATYCGMTGSLGVTSRHVTPRPGGRRRRKSDRSASTSFGAAGRTPCVRALQQWLEVFLQHQKGRHLGQRFLLSPQFTLELFELALQVTKRTRGLA